MRQRRGFTLVEIMVALVVLLLVSAAIYKLLITTQRLSRVQAERASLQSNVRTGTVAVPTELRELNTVLGGAAHQNDILAFGADSITYRAMRGLGFLCQSPTVNTEIRVWKDSYSGYRTPEFGRDNIYVFIDGDPDISTDDAWLPVQVTGVTPGTACPGGAASITLTTEAKNQLLGLSVETPVRTYEVMQLKLYVAADGKSWLGARSVSAGEVSVQPMLGPLQAGNGFQLEYLAANGATTTDPKAVKSIRVTIRGLTDQAVSLSGGSSTLGYAQESLVAQVVLRNSIQP